MALDLAAALSGASAAAVLAITLLCALLGLVAHFVQEARESQSRTELLLEQLEDAREEQLRAAAFTERGRIASELHDVLAHSLSGAAIQLQGARLLVEREQASASMHTAIDRASDLVKDGLANARQAVGAPAAATYHRRFLILRRFMRWLSSREGVPDPFLDLEAPRKPRQESEWLTPAEFRRMLEAAGRPLRRHTGIIERDRLVLLALVTTGLRRSELITLNWCDLNLDGDQPSVLVRHGKGDKPRRQPLAPQVAKELRAMKHQLSPASSDPVFCGLAGGRLQPKVLAAIIKRAAERAGLEKRVTAHTLRHTAATWLRQETGDARLVAEYLGHADLSTVSRYTHVAERELHAATAALGRLASSGSAQEGELRSAGRATVSQRPVAGFPPFGLFVHQRNHFPTPPTDSGMTDIPNRDVTHPDCYFAVADSRPPAPTASRQQNYLCR